MAELRVTYDQEADAAYVYFVDPAQVDVKSARTYTCDEDSVDCVACGNDDSSDWNTVSSPASKSMACWAK